ncbi:MAG TPA: hypothetical protein VHU80_15060 [Polyangiaceae bacterium]|jgi:hypothetical protein|nr:hypothetical protein [Polyangiaceae bacterium]
MKRLISFLAVGFAFQYALGGIAGCSSADPQKKPSTPAAQRNGTLTMALEATSDSGKVYRLRNATFLVSPEIFFEGAPIPLATPASTVDGGPIMGAGGSPAFIDGGGPVGGAIGFGGFGTAGFAGGIIEAGGSFSTGGSISTIPGSITLSSEEDPNAPVLERFLSPAPYDIQLFDGWFVEQVDNLLGSSAIVPATLESSSFQFFDITSDQETFVRFDFLVDGSRVTFGPPGRLIIGIGIHETGGNGSCGNGFRDGAESCDGFDLGGQTCASVTMGARPFGSLFCTPTCDFDTTFCTGGSIEDGGTGGFSGTGGSVGLPPVDAGMGTAADGAAGSKPIP